MPTGKYSDDVVEKIIVVLEHHNIVATPRFVEDLRRVVVEVAAQEKRSITEHLVTTYLKRRGLL